MVQSKSSPTRNAQSEEAYLRRALWFESCASKHLGLSNVSPLEVAAFAIQKKPGWAKATWRQIKASLVYRYTEMNTPDSLAACAMLRSESQAGCIDRSTNSSALRKKNISDEYFGKVIGVLRNRRSQYASHLERWLTLGALTGLRPHEWCFSSVIYIDNPESDSDSNGPLIPVLRVRNAKRSNGRSHGAYRHLSLALLDTETIQSIGDFCATMKQHHTDRSYDRMYDGCRRLLARICLSLNNGDSTKKRLQIYSSRHRFSSDAKNRMSLDEIAATMGHATDLTANRHYGKRRYGKGSVMVTPFSNEVGRVKRSAKGWLPKRGQPPKPNPGQED